ncbi:MAG: hypothetical protein JWM93_2031 [Frankiales bacterium]|nr:hypothetical protein [Frankiales bacterium]
MLLALIEGLPEESAYVASVRDNAPPQIQIPGPAPRPSFRGWTRMHALLADQYDQAQLSLIALGHWKKGKEPKFEPWPRPTMRTAAPEGFVSSLRKRFGFR